MKMCLAPCYQGCTDERYGEEAAAVESFLATRGDSRLVVLRTQRDQASADLEFESAAALHAQVLRVEGVRALAPELVRPLSQLRAVILQASANPGEVAVFLYENARLRGPAPFSTLGMRIQNEHSGSTSLFAHPMAIEPILEPAEVGDQGLENRDQGSQIRGRGSENRDQEPKKSDQVSEIGERGSGDQGLEKGSDSPEREMSGESEVSGEPEVSGHDFSRAANTPQSMGALAPEDDSPENTPRPARLPRGVLESRMEAALSALSEPESSPSATQGQGHLALLKRWYYRPEARRTGEIFFPDPEGHWPIKAILRGAGRVAAARSAPGA
jgi:hypothetical protein